MALTNNLRLFVLTLLLAFALGRVAFAAEDLPTPAPASAKSAQYKRADGKYYAHGDVLKADPGAVILPPTAFAQNGEIYTYTPKTRAPRTIYAEVPNDWIEPITPPDMPASLNIAPDAMQIREPHGDVEVAPPNAPTTFSPAVDGQPIPSGAVVKTGANSTAAILFGGVDSARLMPNSEAAVQQAVASTSRAAEVDLTTGGVFSKVGTQVGVQGDYQVHTPYGTAITQGGDFVALIASSRVDIWVAQGKVDLLQPDGKKYASATGTGTGPLKLIRYPAISNPDKSLEIDADSLSEILAFIPMANQKLAALHQKAAAGVPLTANEQAYVQRIKQVPALIKLAIIVPPPSQLTVLADGTVGFQGTPLSLVELTSKLKDFVAGTYEPSVVVMAGTGATYANFQAALKACKDAGVPKITTEGAVPAAPPPPPAPQDVVVSTGGMVKLNGAALKLDDVIAKLKALAGTAPDVAVTVHAEPKASFTDITAVIDACKGVPVKNLNIDLPKLTELTVAVHGDGTILFHGATLGLDEFKADIKAAVQLESELPIVVHSNPKADYTKFTAVVEACKDTGAKEVTIVQPAPQPPPPPSFKVLVQADGTIKFQDAALKLDEFTTKFKDALAATPDATVTIHAEPKASYADVSAAIDAIKAASPKNFNPTLPAAKELTVTVHGDNTILFHGTTVSADAFANEIKAGVALNPDAAVVIHSNPKADYTKFQAVVDACKATGAKEVTVVQPAPQPPKPVAVTPPPAPLATPPTVQPLPAPAPSAAEGKPQLPTAGAPPQPLTVIAHGDGSIKFQGKTMQIDEFTAKIKDAVAAHPDVAVIIHSNPKLDYAKFEAVVDACKNAPAKEVDVVPPAPQPPAAPVPSVPPTPAPAVTSALVTPPTPPAPSKPLKPLTVLVHDDGTVGFQGKRGTLDEFKTKLAAMVAATPTRELVIKTSGANVAYDHVKAVLDACADAHVSHVTAPEPPPAPAVAAETPSTNAAPTPPAPAPVNDKPVPAEIDLAADGTLKLDGATVTEDDLKSKLTDIKATHPKNPLVMMKQPGVTKEQWMHYVDLCHSLGLKLLVKNAKAPAITPLVATPPVLRPSAAEGGPTVQPLPAPEPTPAPAPETAAPSTNAPAAITSAEESVPVEIELTPDGLIAFLGETVSDAELQTRLNNVARANLKEPVLIVKDEKVTHEQLQHVLDMCRTAKLRVKVKVVKSSDTGALTPHATLPVALEPPPADNGAIKVLPIEIGLATKGRITFEGSSVTLDELKARLTTVAQGNPSQPIVIMKQADVTDDSADALATVCQGVSPQLKISVKTAPSFLPDNAPSANLPAPDVHLHASMDALHGEASASNP
ncbi:MAG TPA: biopolymer transporter ExbD [Candidatus Methylacidiphilales bacterium]|jgi:biopolymer transport protein ExbD|nr:biopolymer transporter ExbD [Candidatus Methylacidiphilales bacterium]